MSVQYVKTLYLPFQVMVCSIAHSTWRCKVKNLEEGCKRSAGKQIRRAEKPESVRS